MSIDEFTGNCLSVREKAYRLEKLEQEIENNQVDEDFIPYLQLINLQKHFMTTQCCTGHGTDDKRASHFDFRCSLPPEVVINEILKPLSRMFPDVLISLYGLQCDRLRYVVWMPSAIWEEITSYFIGCITVYNRIQRESEIS